MWIRKLVAAFFLFAPLLFGEPQDTVGSIRGSVIHPLTMSGISDVRVQICPSLTPECTKPLATSTDGDGRFLFQGVKADSYVLTATRIGYTAPTPIEKPEIVTLTVTLNLDRPDVVLQPLHMVRSAAMNGTVLNAQGRPVPDAVVGAIVREDPRDQAGMVITARSTNDRGEYRLFGLPPGRYYVMATSVVSLRIFHPSAFELADATEIVVTEGQDINGISIIARSKPREATK